MKNNLRGKIREFVQSEEGKVGVKSPLTIGVATASLLVAQAIVGTTPALACLGTTDCADGFVCDNFEEECEYDTCAAEWVCWDEGECVQDH